MNAAVEKDSRLGRFRSGYFDKRLDMKKKLYESAAAIAMFVMAGSAMAESTTSALAVSATVNNACSIGAATMNFGNLTASLSGGNARVAPVNVDATTSVAVICTLGAVAKVGGNSGLHNVAAVRKMASGTDLLVYDLYAVAARTTVLDEVIAAAGTIAYTGTGATGDTVTIYGRILAADVLNAKKGAYSDTVTLSIFYTL